MAMTCQPVFTQQFRPGASVSDFVVQDMNRHPLNYKSLKENVTVVMFFSTRCPHFQCVQLSAEHNLLDFNKRVKFIVVDSNSNESFDEVRTYAKDVGFDFPVYKDVNNEVADRFGVMATTDTFVIDANGVVQYRGYIEDALNPSRMMRRALRFAIESLLDGKPVEVGETSARRCAIRHEKQ
jgi:alkyl hydroperoxide reductase subunit AhpC